MIPYSPPPIPSPAQYNVESAKKTIDTRVQHCMWGGVEWSGGGHGRFKKAQQM